MASSNSFAIAPPLPDEHLLEIGTIRLRVVFRVNHRARNYVLHVRRDGSLTVTIPRYGSMRGARNLLENRKAWIARALKRLKDRPQSATSWIEGSQVLFRGEPAVLQIREGLQGRTVHLGEEFCGMMPEAGDLRQIVERHLLKLAARELPLRLIEFARQHGCRVSRVTVRSQRTRWGSCSRRGTISLNWRLIQTPEKVRDYILLHELMHLREMNHSDRFWSHVANVCPGYNEAEQWLKANGRLLGI